MPVLLATFGIFALVTAPCREVRGGEYKTDRMASCRTDDPISTGPSSQFVVGAQKIAMYD